MAATSTPAPTIEDLQREYGSTVAAVEPGGRGAHPARRPPRQALPPRMGLDVAEPQVRHRVRRGPHGGRLRARLLPGPARRAVGELAAGVGDDGAEPAIESARITDSGGVDLDFGLGGWFWLVCIAVVSTVVASLTFFAGMRRTGPSTAAILSIFEPIVTSGLAALTLGESLAPIQFLGGLLVLSAVVVLQAGRTPAEPHRPPNSRLDQPSSPHTQVGNSAAQC